MYSYHNTYSCVSRFQIMKTGIHWIHSPFPSSCTNIHSKKTKFERKICNVRRKETNALSIDNACVIYNKHKGFDIKRPDLKSSENLFFFYFLIFWRQIYFWGEENDLHYVCLVYCMSLIVSDSYSIVFDMNFDMIVSDSYSKQQSEFQVWLVQA